MNYSLNELAESIAERGGRQFDMPFREQIKLWIAAWRSKMIADSLNRKPQDRKFFYSSIEAELIKIPTTELVHCFPEYTLKTKRRIPQPLRSNSMLFDFVGSIDMVTSFTQVESHYVPFLSTAKYTGKNIKASWIDGYLYIFGTLSLETVRITGIFDNLAELAEYKAPGLVDYAYSDDLPYPVPLDVQQRIVQAILSVEMRQPIPTNDTEVKVDGQN